MRTLWVTQAKQIEILDFKIRLKKIPRALELVIFIIEIYDFYPKEKLEVPVLQQYP